MTRLQLQQVGSTLKKDFAGCVDGCDSRAFVMFSFVFLCGVPLAAFIGASVHAARGPVDDKKPIRLWWSYSHPKAAPAVHRPTNWYRGRIPCNLSPEQNLLSSVNILTAGNMTDGKSRIRDRPSRTAGRLCENARIRYSIRPKIIVDSSKEVKIGDAQGG